MTVEHVSIKLELARKNYTDLPVILIDLAFISFVAFIQRVHIPEELDS